MAAPRDELLDHDYDGIEEFDNPLPKWWVYMFYGCILFAVGYVPYYHFGPGPLPREQWAEDMTKWWEQHPPPVLASAAELAAMAAEPSFVAAGQSIYAVRCVACHAADGGGLVGPNLTDEFTIYGQDRDKIVGVVYHGTKNGMLAWKDQLKLTEIYQVSAFVHSLRGSSPATPKQAQGVPIVAQPVAAASTDGEKRKAG
jgi:cytochrome c oxidase cbb3-type subunit 3